MFNGLKLFQWDILNPASHDTHETYLLHHWGDKWETVVSSVTPRVTYFFISAGNQLQLPLYIKSLTSEGSSHFLLLQWQDTRDWMVMRRGGVMEGGEELISVWRGICWSSFLLLSFSPPSLVTFCCISQINSAYETFNISLDAKRISSQNPTLLFFGSEKSSLHHHPSLY